LGGAAAGFAPAGDFDELLCAARAVNFGAGGGAKREGAAALAVLEFKAFVFLLLLGVDGDWHCFSFSEKEKGPAPRGGMSSALRHRARWFYGDLFFLFN
jgi:hypothetical protein